MSRGKFDEIMALSTKHDWDIATHAWFRYNRITADIAHRHLFPAYVGAAVFAALSPNSDYIGNLRDTNRLLEAVKLRKGLADFNVSTYESNKIKGWRIAKGEDPLELIVANKTRNFFLNVTNPSNPVPVTCDGHIFNAWGGTRIKLSSGGIHIYHNKYHEVAEAIREIAREHGVLPNVIQGVIWFTYKRIHQIRISSQMEFWQPEYYVIDRSFRIEACLQPTPPTNQTVFASLARAEAAA